MVFGRNPKKDFQNVVLSTGLLSTDCERAIQHGESALNLGLQGNKLSLRWHFIFLTIFLVSMAFSSNGCINRWADQPFTGCESFVSCKGLIYPSKYHQSGWRSKTSDTQVWKKKWMGFRDLKKDCTSKIESLFRSAGWQSSLFFFRMTQSMAIHMRAHNWWIVGRCSWEQYC